LSVCASKPMGGWRQCEDTCRHLTACFGAKQVGLGFLVLPQLAEERRQMVHVASSWRSRGREAKDGRFNCVECDAAEVRPNYPLVVVVFISAHGGILVFYFCI
jgi:hypothetical protein